MTWWTYSSYHMTCHTKFVVVRDAFGTPEWLLHAPYVTEKPESAWQETCRKPPSRRARVDRCATTALEMTSRHICRSFEASS